MSVPANVYIKYFQGDSDNLDAVRQALREWVSSTRPAGYQINSTVHFHAEDRKWHVLVTVLYQATTSGISIPNLTIPRRPAD